MADSISTPRDSSLPGELDSGAASPWGWLASPWIWGGLATLGFYRVLPQIPLDQELLHRYFCGHPLEYAQAALFFVGMAALVGKLYRLTQEKQSAALPLPAVPEGGEAVACAQAIRHGLAQLPGRLRRTWYADRLNDIADYLRGRRVADGIDEHAKHLAETCSNRHLDGYAQLQTIIWAIPILGFLGTVMGITLAIANVTPEQLDTSLNSVTGGLAVAFDTTAVALTESIVVVFAAFFIKRGEQRVLDTIEDKIFKGLVTPLAGAAQRNSPMMEAETRAARELLTRTESLIETQTGLWRESVEGLRTRWTQTLDQQQQELSRALSGGVETSLSHHADLLSGLRGEFLQVYQGISDELRRQIEESREAQTAQQHQARQLWDQAWQQMQSDLHQERAARREESERVLALFSEQMAAASHQLAATTHAVESQMAAIGRQTELLSRVVGTEEQLAGLQQRLTENLEALHAAESLQETLHSLNAAIHLLTARARPRAA